MPLSNRHTINLTSGRPWDGAFAPYTVIPADKSAILSDEIPFTDGVVVPFALEAAAYALSLKEPGVAMPGVGTPALALPYPSLHDVPPSAKTLVIYGCSSSVGSMTTRIATAAGTHVIAISGAHNFDFCKRCGAARVFDHKDSSLAGKVVEAVREDGGEFIWYLRCHSYHRDLCQEHHDFGAAGRRTPRLRSSTSPSYRPPYKYKSWYDIRCQ